MIRCTIELLPGGDELRKKTIGLVEIANIGGTAERGNYTVVCTKTVPFSGALEKAWRKAKMPPEAEDEDVLAGRVTGHHRTRRGVYDLLYRGLAACGMAERNPKP